MAETSYIIENGRRKDLKDAAARKSIAELANRVLALENGGVASALPNGYTLLEYIQSSGTQYINTGFVPNQDTRLVMDAQITDTATKHLYGARTSTTSADRFFAACTSATTFRADYCNTQNTHTVQSVLNRTLWDVSKDGSTIDGETKTFPEATFSPNVTIALFASNTAGTIVADTYKAKMKLFACQIYDNGTLVRDYVPCLNLSGEAGLYDKVNGVFYGNAGTGSFDHNHIGLPDTYTSLSYIQSSGTQYIDTGFIPNQDTRVVTEVEFAVSSGVNWLFGARTGAQNASFAYLSVANYYRADYAAQQYAFSTSVSFTGKHTVDFNKNIINLNGVASGSLTHSSFVATKPLSLFGINSNGTITKSTGAKMYSCQIYDNGTLVRDFVPCINPSGVYGLYDRVSKTFYGNAGSGNFTGA